MGGALAGSKLAVIVYRLLGTEESRMVAWARTSAVGTPEAFTGAILRT
jgi:hypothetical protein